MCSRSELGLSRVTFVGESQGCRAIKVCTWRGTASVVTHRYRWLYKRSRHFPRSAQRSMDSGYYNIMQ